MPPDSLSPPNVAVPVILAGEAGRTDIVRLLLAACPAAVGLHACVGDLTPGQAAAARSSSRAERACGCAACSRPSCISPP